MRFSRPLPLRPDTDAGVGDGELPPFNARGVEVAATAGGVTNGLVGAWGPVVTPFLLHRGLPPRFAIGSVNTAEVAVARRGRRVAHHVARRRGPRGRASCSPCSLGGMLAAPLAAYVVRFVPARALGLAVAGLLLLTQTRELATAFELGRGRWIAYGVVGLLILAAALRPRLGRRSERRRVGLAS